MAKMMEDTPILILSFKTQQTEVVRDRMGDIVSGSPVTVRMTIKDTVTYPLCM
jgi:hypothetical protein